MRWFDQQGNFHLKIGTRGGIHPPPTLGGSHSAVFEVEDMRGDQKSKGPGQAECHFW